MASGSGRNAFEILMNQTREVVLSSKLIAPEGNTLRGDQKLHNDVLDELVRMGVGWSPDAVTTTRENFVKALSHALWALDPYHTCFQDRAISLLSAFIGFQGYNDWQRQKQKQPQLGHDFHLGKDLGFHGNNSPRHSWYYHIR